MLRLLESCTSDYNIPCYIQLNMSVLDVFMGESFILTERDGSTPKKYCC